MRDLSVFQKNTITQRPHVGSIKRLPHAKKHFPTRCGESIGSLSARKSPRKIGVADAATETIGLKITSGMPARYEFRGKEDGAASTTRGSCNFSRL